MGAVNGYVAIILILATILLMVCIALFYLLGNEKKRAINKEYGLTGMADVERSTEELPGTMNKTDDNTESLLSVDSVEEKNVEHVPLFYELQSIIFIHTDTIIE